MKKNLMSVIILAICIVNLVLNIMLVFVCMPSAQKTNRLITEISSVLKLELESGNEVANVDVADIRTFSSTEDITINLKTDDSGTTHYAVVGLTISMDGSSDDYEDLNELLTSGEGLVNDDVRTIIGSYTAEELSDIEVQNEIKTQILVKLQNRFGSACIYSVDFSKFLIS